METLENINDSPENDIPARKKPTEKWYPYFLINGNLREKELKQQFEIADCPTRDEVEMAIVESKYHPSGKYRVERKVSGQPTKDFFYCEKPEASFFQQPAHKPIIELAPDFENSDETDNQQSNPQFEDLVSLLIQKVEGLEDRLQDPLETAQSSSNETVMLSVLREMQKQGERNLQQSEKSFQQGLQMAQMIMQSAKPQQDPTAMMLQMLQGTLAVQKGVRELSEEIAPDNSNGGGGSLIADGAKLIESLGKNAGTLLPLIFGGGIGKAPAAPRTAKPQNAPATNGDGQNGGIVDLVNKVKAKEANKK